MKTEKMEKEVSDEENKIDYRDGGGQFFDG